MLQSTYVIEEKQIYIDHDRLFKELILAFFEEFIEAFFPDEYRHIDFSTATFSKQELFTDIVKGERRQIDILVEIKLKHEEQMILIHIEPQSTYHTQFHERMFIYCSRLYEKHRKPILPISIFSYNNKKAVPNIFSLTTPTFPVLTFQYLQLHLVNKNWRQFIDQDNPVVAALLSKMGYTESERVQVKLKFLRMISRLELNPAKMKLLYGFFETYLKLNEQEEKEMRDKISELPEEEATRVLKLPNSYYEKGLEEGLKRVIKNMLQKEFSINRIVEVTGVDESEIKKIQKRLDQDL